MFSMAITTTDIIIILAAFIICFLIAELAKWHVRKNCQDNPEIIWIWLDEDEEPQGGCKIKNDKPGERISLRMSTAPDIQGI